MQDQQKNFFPNAFQIPDALRLTVCLVFCTLFLGNVTGCVRRRLTINSNPQGAMVYVDGHQIGKTPVSTDFTYYGTRNIRLELDNHQTLTVKQKITPPWYQFPPFDFFAETCTPADIKDSQIFTYDLHPKTEANDDQILARAQNFAYEGSRSINPDGSLGTPITSQNFQPRVGGDPDAGFHSAPSAAPSAAPYPAQSAVPLPDYGSGMMPAVPGSDPSVPSSIPQTQTVPAADPNAFPTGSADWDTPNRYPQNH